MMDDKHAALVKLQISKLKNGSSRAFYYVTDGDRRILHIDKRKGSSKRFGDVKKISSHLKPYGGAVSSSAKMCAGKVTRTESGLVFVPKIRKGAADSELQKGLVKLKAKLKLGAFVISKSEVEVGTSSKDAVASTVEQTQARNRKLRRKLSNLEGLSRDKLKSLIAELTDLVDTNDETVWGPRLAQAQEEVQRRRRQARLAKVYEELRSLDLSAADEEALAQALSNARKYQKRGGPEDVSGLLSQITAQQVRITQVQTISDAVESVSEQSADLLAQLRTLRTSQPDPEQIDDVQELLSSLETARDALMRQREALTSLAS